MLGSPSSAVLQVAGTCSKLRLGARCIAFTSMFVFSPDLAVISGKDLGAICNTEIVDVI